MVHTAAVVIAESQAREKELLAIINMFRVAIISCLYLTTSAIIVSVLYTCVQSPVLAACALHSEGDLFYTWFFSCGRGVLTGGGGICGVEGMGKGAG